MAPRSTTGKVLIRPARVADVPAIVGLWKELVDRHAKIDRVFERRKLGHRIFGEFVSRGIRSRRAAVYVAESGGRIVGYLLGGVRSMPPPLKPGLHATISDTCVTRGCRRRGIGTGLVRAFKVWCAGHRLSRIEVSHIGSNREASEFWRRIGFRPFRMTDVMRLGPRKG